MMGRRFYRRETQRCYVVLEDGVSKTREIDFMRRDLGNRPTDEEVQNPSQQ